MKQTAACFWLLVSGTIFTSIPALADSPLGVYVGAAVGESDVTSRDNHASNLYLLRYDHDYVAWKGFIGVRPLSALGFELAYIDFGNARPPPPSSTFFGYFKDNSQQNAPALFGIGYLPLPFLDLYAKLGVARLHTDAQATYLPPTCPVGYFCIPYTVRENQRTTNLAYGAGAQTRFGAIAIRAEYEQISAGGGNPSLFSLGVAWRF